MDGNLNMKQQQNFQKSIDLLGKRGWFWRPLIFKTSLQFLLVHRYFLKLLWGPLTTPCIFGAFDSVLLSRPFLEGRQRLTMLASLLAMLPQTSITRRRFLILVKNHNICITSFMHTVFLAPHLLLCKDHQPPPRGPQDMSWTSKWAETHIPNQQILVQYDNFMHTK